MDELAPHTLLTSVQAAYTGAHWYIILHRRLESVGAAKPVDQYCTPFIRDNLIYYDAPRPLSGGPSLDVEGARREARRLADLYESHGFKVWLMRDVTCRTCGEHT
mgnify:FL=1